MIFFDSYALLELIWGSENYKRFKEEVIVSNTLNLSEVIYALLKYSTEGEVRKLMNRVQINFLDITEEIAFKSALFRKKNKSKKLSYADCLGYITAMETGMSFLTGDKEFEGLKNVEFVK